jgi:hypothetical protein
MFVKRVNRFNAITRSAELLNKKIQQIDLSLLEASLINDAQGLSVKGFVERQIKYHEYDGCLRKITDRIQFTIYMGKSVTEPLSSLQTELQQDYFILQPGNNETGAAILDQGFLITVRGLDRVETTPKMNILRVDSIITQGRGSTIVKIPIDSLRPKAFSGKVRFTDYTHLPVVVAEISGFITQRTPENLLQETDISETISLLVNAPVPNQEQALLIEGSIKEAAWQGKSTGLDGCMALQLDYRWYLTEPKELCCVEHYDGSNSAREQIQTLTRLDNRSFHFSKNILITVPELVEEFRLEQFSYKNTATRKGWLLNTDLTWGVVFINSSGLEEYRELRSQFDELFPYFSDIYQTQNYTWTANLQVEMINHVMAGTEVNITIDCLYRLDLYQKRITTVMEDNNSGEMIYAEILVGKERFSLTADERFDLKRPPIRMLGITAKLLEFTGEVKKGLLVVNGNLEAHITYIDQEHVLREDLFQSSFRDFYIWNQYSDQAQVQIYANLDSDNYRLMNTCIFYHYLIGISAEMFHKKVLRVAVVKNPVSVVSPNSGTSTGGLSPGRILNDLLVEGKIPLRHGNVKEVAASRVLLSQFNYRNSHNAVLVSGNLCGELEYWDDKRYLQKITIDLPFWRFIRNESGIRLMHNQLIPLVKSCSFFPLRSKFWRKGSIKIHLELEFCQAEKEEHV